MDGRVTILCDCERPSYGACAHIEGLKVCQMPDCRSKIHTGTSDQKVMTYDIKAAYKKYLTGLVKLSNDKEITYIKWIELKSMM